MISLNIFNILNKYSIAEHFTKKAFTIEVKNTHQKIYGFDQKNGWLINRNQYIKNLTNINIQCKSLNNKQISYYNQRKLVSSLEYVIFEAVVSRSRALFVSYLNQVSKKPFESMNLFCFKDIFQYQRRRVSHSQLPYNYYGLKVSLVIAKKSNCNLLDQQFRQNISFEEQRKIELVLSYMYRSTQVKKMQDIPVPSIKIKYSLFLPISLSLTSLIRLRLNIKLCFYSNPVLAVPLDSKKTENRIEQLIQNSYNRKEISKFKGKPTLPSTIDQLVEQKNDDWKFINYDKSIYTQTKILDRYNKPTSQRIKFYSFKEYLPEDFITFQLNLRHKANLLIEENPQRNLQS